MMKTKTSILSRCMAMLLALVLSFANVPGLVLTAFAAEYDASISAGKVMAENYDVTAAEKALLSSGYLAGDYTIEYNIPGDDDNLIEVNVEEKTITAKDFEDWTAVKAEIVVNNAVEEDVALTDKVGTYTYGGNAFSVKVYYVYNEDVYDENDPEKMLQNQMLDAMEHLKDGVANLDAVEAQSGNLYILEQAMPEMVNFAENGIALGSSGMSVGFAEDGAAAIKDLNTQLTANGGVLNLSKMINEIESKTAYIENNGAAMQEEIASLLEKLAVINTALNTLYNNISWAISGGIVSENTANQVKTLAGVCSNLATGLATVNADPWYAANHVDEVFGKSGDATLDALVAALGDLTSVATTNPLKVAETSVTANMAMKNVTVNVVLNVVKGDADSAELVAHDTNTVVIAVDENATAEQVAAKVKENGIEADSLVEWVEVYVDGKYAATTSTLPETLIEDITYTITYNPVDCEITGGIAGLPTSVPYGYVLTLPVHENTEKAYDYTVNGAKYAQGAKYTVVGTTNISRTDGKSYTTDDLYSIVAGNYANDAAKDILTSGALKGNVVINYRKPDPADSESLVKLEGDQVTAEATYAASYENLNWVPYTYGANGNENKFSGNTADWTETSVKVVYRLDFTNFGVAEVESILGLAGTLKEEAAGQISVMDNLAGEEATLKQLDKTKFGALNGVIGVTDFTPGDSTDTDAKNLELRAYFSSVVSSIIANNLDANNFLTIYNYILGYNAGGLEYYYQNAENIIAEIEELAGYLGKMTAEEEALRIMVTAAGFPEYADKISDVETKLNDILNDLKAPNEAIDLNSENLGKLVDALTADGEVSYETAGYPYVLSAALTAADASQVYVQVIINDNEATVTSEMITRGEKFTAEIYAKLKNEMNAALANILVGGAKYYNLAVEGVDLDGLIDLPLDKVQNIRYSYTPIEYTVKLDGAALENITIKDLTINLPKHETTGWEYRYTIDGVEGITASTYTFTAEQIDKLFTDGTYTITRVEENKAAEDEADKFEEAFGEWIVEDENGNVSLFASVAADQNGLMGFVETIAFSQYSYIGLNGKAFLNVNDEDPNNIKTEIRLQTLIDTILADSQFSSQTLINLGNNGKGEFAHAKMQIGNSATDIIEEVDFTLYFESVPAQMKTVANGLEAVKDYITFNSNPAKARSLTGKDVLDINVNLPEKVYEVYLAALLATGNVDKDDMNAINNEIAIMFLYDYIDLLVDTDATTTTYTNTLKKLGIDKDLTKAEDYYQLAKKAFKHLDVNTIEDDGIADVLITGNGKKGIDGLVNLLGIDLGSYKGSLGLIYEYNGDGRDLTATANVKLLNTESGFEAALVDVKQPANKTTDHLNKFDFTKDLPNRVKTLAGEAAVILLDTVDGDLVFDQPTILDLNGKTVNGNIVANAKVLIFDSSLDTFNCGTVTGTVSKEATIVGGKYPNCNVEGFLPDGYVVEDYVVRNVLYTIAEDNGNVTFKADADIIDVLADGGIASYTEAATAIAADMAVDLVLNYFTSASLTAGGFELYNITLDDIIGLYSSTNRKQQLIDQAIEWVSLEGLNKFINYILDQMINFAAIENAIDKDQAIVSFEATVAPWSVTVAHKTAGDYITFGIAPNEKLKDTFNVGLVLDGEDAKQDYAEKLFGNLAEINEDADAQVEILKPTFNNNHLTVSGKGNATFIFNVTNKHLGDNADFTNEEYINVLAVVLANGVESAKAKALTDAIKTYNAENSDDMKAAIDALTVKDVFDAFKKLNRNDTFAKIANDLGVAVEGDAAELEEIYHLIVVAAGKALDVLDVTGPSKTLGSLYNSTSGYYELNVDRSANKSVSKGGYTITVGAEITELILKVKLFDDGHVHVVDPSKTKEIETLPATCGKDGSKTITYYCACGHKMDEVTTPIPATGNHKNIITDTGYPATCVAKGLTDGEHCGDCGTVITAQVEIPVDPDAHNFIGAKVNYNWAADHSSCEASRECVNGCGHSETSQAARITKDTVPATCMKEGKVTYTATFNDTWAGIATDEEVLRIDPNNHQHFGPWKVVKPATRTETGIKERECACGNYTETAIIPKLPNRPSDNDEIIIDLTGKNEDEENPSTGAPVKSGSALCAMAVLAGAAFVAEAMKKH